MSHYRRGTLKFPVPLSPSLHLIKKVHQNRTYNKLKLRCICPGLLLKMLLCIQINSKCQFITVVCGHLLSHGWNVFLPKLRLPYLSSSRSDEFWRLVFYLWEAESPHCCKTKDAWQEAARPVQWRTLGKDTAGILCMSAQGSQHGWLDVVSHTLYRS